MAFVQIMEFRTSDIERAWRGAAARARFAPEEFALSPSPASGRTGGVAAQV